MEKALTMKTGQTHVHRYLPRLLGHIEAGELEASSIISHRMTLDEAPHAYDIFNAKKDGCVKVVLRPAA